MVRIPRDPATAAQGRSNPADPLSLRSVADHTGGIACLPMGKKSLLVSRKMVQGGLFSLVSGRLLQGCKQLLSLLVIRCLPAELTRKQLGKFKLAVPGSCQCHLPDRKSVVEGKSVVVR